MVGVAPVGSAALDRGPDVAAAAFDFASVYMLALQVGFQL